jgi:hypothetical protein
MKRRDESGRQPVSIIAAELANKEPYTRSARELEQEMHKDYVANIITCVEKHKSIFPHDFYIVVITSKEALMKNVIRNRFLARLSCPTPDYDNTVYKYHRKDDRIEFLWVVPSMECAEMLHDNVLEVIDDDKPLLKYVLDFYDGTLARLAIKLNKEDEGSSQLVPRKGELLC